MRMALETVPKDLRHLRACLLCSLVKVSAGGLVVGATEEAQREKEGGVGDTGSEIPGGRRGSGTRTGAVVDVERTRAGRSCLPRARVIVAAFQLFAQLRVMREDRSGRVELRKSGGEQYVLDYAEN